MLELNDAMHPLSRQVRQATNKDSDSVRALVFGVLASYGLRPDPGNTDADLDDIEGCYFRRGGVFYVVDMDGAIRGSAGLCPLDRESCELRKMYLQREYRGRGIGKYLMDLLLADARRLGFRRVVLETASVLREAITIYRNYGFRPYEPEHLAGRCDQAYLLELD